MPYVAKNPGVTVFCTCSALAMIGDWLRLLSGVSEDAADVRNTGHASDRLGELLIVRETRRRDRPSPRRVDCGDEHAIAVEPERHVEQPSECREQKRLAATASISDNAIWADRSRSSTVRAFDAPSGPAGPRSAVDRLTLGGPKGGRCAEKKSRPECRDATVKPSTRQSGVRLKSDGGVSRRQLRDERAASPE